MDIRLAQMRDISAELRPVLRKAISDAERAMAKHCSLNFSILSIKEAKEVLKHLELIGENPSEEKDSSFITEELTKYSGDPKWERLKCLIELGKR